MKTLRRYDFKKRDYFITADTLDEDVGFLASPYGETPNPTYSLA